MPETVSAQPETRVAFILGFTISLTVLTLIVLAMRIYARVSIIGQFRVEDWLVVGAAFGIVIESTSGCVSTKYGAGYHTQDMKPEWAVPYSKLSFTSGMSFPICVTLPKLSLCLTYLRIFPSRGNRIFCHVAIVYLISWMVASSLAIIFGCSPTAASLNPTIRPATCINMRKFYIASGSLNTLSDFLVYLAPTRQLWNAKLPKRKRIELITVFASGCIVCVAGIVRLVYLQIVFTSPDFAYNGAIIWVTASIEMNVGFICSCLHAVKPLIGAWFPNLFASNSGSNSNCVFFFDNIHGNALDKCSFPFQTLYNGQESPVTVPTQAAKNPFGNKSGECVPMEGSDTTMLHTSNNYATWDTERETAWTTSNEDASSAIHTPDATAT